MLLLAMAPRLGTSDEDHGSTESDGWQISAVYNGQPVAAVLLISISGGPLVHDKLEDLDGCNARAASRDAWVNAMDSMILLLSSPNTNDRHTSSVSRVCVVICWCGTSQERSRDSDSFDHELPQEFAMLPLDMLLLNMG